MSHFVSTNSSNADCRAWLEQMGVPTYVAIAFNGTMGDLACYVDQGELQHALAGVDPTIVRVVFDAITTVLRVDKRHQLRLWIGLSACGVIGVVVTLSVAFAEYLVGEAVFVCSMLMVALTIGVTATCIGLQRSSYGTIRYSASPALVTSPPFCSAL